MAGKQLMETCNINYIGKKTKDAVHVKASFASDS